MASDSLSAAATSGGGAVRKDEGAAAVDEEVAEKGGSRDYGTAGAQGFSARQHHHEAASLNLGREAPSFRPEHTGGVGLVYQEECIGRLSQSLQFRQRGPVSFHGIQTFDHDPGCAGRAVSTPSTNGIAGGIDIVVAKRTHSSHARASFHRASGMNVLIVDDKVPALRLHVESRAVCRCMARAERMARSVRKNLAAFSSRRSCSTMIASERPWTALIHRARPVPAPR